MVRLLRISRLRLMKLQKFRFLVRKESFLTHRKENYSLINDKLNKMNHFDLSNLADNPSLFSWYFFSHSAATYKTLMYLFLFWEFMCNSILSSGLLSS